MIQKKTMRGIIYTRVSSEEQVEGTSLALQEELCRKYCEQKDIEVAAIFREEGESAKDLSLNNRKRFLESLEFCRKHKGQLQAFVVLKVDRFARNTDDHFAVRKILLGYGVTLHSVTEPIGNKPAEKFVETVLAGAAEYDNAIRKQRCTDGMLARINQGIWPFHPPIGYVCAQFKRRGEKKTRPDDPDERLFPILQRGLRAYARGEVTTLYGLAKQLDVWGLAEARGRRATPQFVDRLLGRSSRFYAGIIVNPWTGEERPGIHNAMITRDELHQIHDRRLGKASKRKRHDPFNPQFPLRRTVRCASCGLFLTAGVSSGNGGSYAYYFCAQKGCFAQSKGIRRELLHSAFLKWMKRIAPTPSQLQLIVESIHEVWNERTAVHSQQRADRERRLAVLMARRQRVCDMREDGTYSAELFRERVGEIDREIGRAQRVITEPLADTIDVDRAVESAKWLGSNLIQLWSQAPPTSRRRFESLVLPEGITYDRRDGFRTAKLGLLFELGSDSGAGNSPKVDLSGIPLNQITLYLKEAMLLHTELAAAKSTDSTPLNH